MNTKIVISFVLAILLLSSCKEDSGTSANLPDTTASNFALVLCEGLWGYNNSTVTKLNLLNFNVINDFTAITNPNFKIGDLGNDIAIRGDTFFVVVTTSKAIELFDIRTGRLLGYITFEGNSAPRRLDFINDSLLAVTDLYQDCVYIVNFRAKRVEKKIPVGPAPEFVVHFNGKLFVTNSGYGDFRANEPKAGTLSVVDLNKMAEVSNIWIGPNPIEIALDRKRNLMFVSYNHLPSFKDSVGGIVVLNPITLERIAEFKTPVRSMHLVDEDGSLFFVGDRNVSRLFFASNKIDTILVNNDSKENWYSVAFDTKNKNILIGNARNYTIDGEVLIFSLKQQNTEFLAKVSVGVNPSKTVIKY
jgi:hypothetical protein